MALLYLLRELLNFHFTKNLLNNPAYKRKDFKKGLEDTFMKMDRLLLSDKGKKELRTYMDEENGD